MDAAEEMKKISGEIDKFIQSVDKKQEFKNIMDDFIKLCENVFSTYKYIGCDNNIHPYDGLKWLLEQNEKLSTFLKNLEKDKIVIK